MPRRVLVLAALIGALIAISRTRLKVAAEKEKTRDAKANWESEGGTPLRDSVDTPLSV